MFYDNTKELEHIAELEEQLADAQRALDAEREKVKGVTQRAEYAEGRVRALLKRGDERDVQLAALQAQLRQVEGDRT